MAGVLEERKSKWFDQEVVKVFLQEKTSLEDRRKICHEWENNNFSYIDGFAQSRGLMPSALLVGSLLDCEHKDVAYDGKFLFDSLIDCSIALIQIELQRSVHSSYQQGCGQPVDNSHLSTGKGEESGVEE